MKWRLLDKTVTEVRVEELAGLTRYPKIRERLHVPLARRLINEIKSLAEWVEDLPTADGSPDPFDNDLLSIAQGGGADYRVTGDKRDLLSLARHGGTAIVGVNAFLGCSESRQHPQ